MTDSTPPITNPPATGGSVERDHGLALAKGTRLGELELEAVLGEGGFAIVYLAFDHSLHRRIAVKEFLPGAYAYRRDDGTIAVRSGQHGETFSAGLRSFVQEARLLASFEHPALVRVHRFWEANGTAYMAMRHYEGRTLRDTLKMDAGFATEARLKELATPLLDVVSMLHDAKCFHRDISPDNIIIQEDGRPVLLDFGAARKIIGELTHVLTAVLKPGYAPVEQYADDEAGFEQGPWTDIYGLAATLHCAVTGKPPPTAVTRIVNDRYASLAERRPDGYTLPFLRAIDGGLAVLPASRIRSVESFRAALFAAEAPDDEKTVRLSRSRPATGVLSTLPPSPFASPSQQSGDDEKTVRAPSITTPPSPSGVRESPPIAPSPRAETPAEASAPPSARGPTFTPSVPAKPRSEHRRLLLLSVGAMAALAVATATWIATQEPAEAPAMQSEATPPSQTGARPAPSPPPTALPQAGAEQPQAVETIPSASKAQATARQAAVPRTESATASSKSASTATTASASPSTRAEAPSPAAASSAPSAPATRSSSPASAPTPPLATSLPSPAGAIPTPPAPSAAASAGSLIPAPSTGTENAVEPSAATKAAPKEGPVGKALAAPSSEAMPPAPAVVQPAPRVVPPENRPAAVAAAKPPATTGRCNCDDLRGTCSVSSRRDTPGSAVGTWRVDVEGHPRCAVIEYRDYRGGPIVKEQIRNGWGIVSVSPMMDAVAISSCRVCAIE
jgi:serine/threonine protein kinase